MFVALTCPLSSSMYNFWNQQSQPCKFGVHECDLGTTKLFHGRNRFRIAVSLSLLLSAICNGMDKHKLTMLPNYLEPLLAL